MVRLVEPWKVLNVLFCSIDRFIIDAFVRKFTILLLKTAPLALRVLNRSLSDSLVYSLLIQPFYDGKHIGAEKPIAPHKFADDPGGFLDLLPSTAIYGALLG